MYDCVLSMHLKNKLNWTELCTSVHALITLRAILTPCTALYSVLLNSFTLSGINIVCASVFLCIFRHILRARSEFTMSGFCWWRLQRRRA